MRMQAQRREALDDGWVSSPVPETMMALEADLLSDEVEIDVRRDPAVVRFRGREIPLCETQPSLASRATTRAFDLVLAGAACLVLPPILGLLALAIKATSPGPVIYRSERLSEGGGTFGMLKFRSMVTDADRALAELFERDPLAKAEYEHNFKLRNDVRITRVGAFMRRTNLDELPQFLNVLRGEMSIVGPRPKLLSEGERYGGCLPAVLNVRPGLTGAWQVSGRNNLSFDERVMIDVEYVATRSLTDDVKICAKTAVQMFSPENGAW